MCAVTVNREDMGHLQAQNVDETQHLGGQGELEHGEDVEVEEGDAEERVRSA